MVVGIAVRKPGGVILAVDDEQDILETITSYLEVAMPDVRVLCAPSAEKGLEILARQQVDLVLSDYRMPGMDGLEFLTRAARLHPDARRLMMTAFPDARIAIHAVNEAKIKAFLTKPMDPTRLKALIEEWLP